MNATILLSLTCLALWACTSVAADVDPIIPRIHDVPEAESEAARVPAQEGGAPQANFIPGPSGDEGYDWIGIVSGEWLKGEFETLNKGGVEFDSDELDNLTFDWEDVHELRGGRPFTLLFTDRSTQTGVPYITRTTVYLTNHAGQYEYPRSRLMRMIPGRPEDRAFWSGAVGLSSAVRAGNTDQTDSGLHANLRRRTAGNRTTLGLDVLISTIDDKESANNRSFAGRDDIYVSPKFFFTPLAVDLFRDDFQNISIRATPSAGVGYTFVDELIDAASGQDRTRFESACYRIR